MENSTPWLGQIQRMTALLSATRLRTIVNGLAMATPIAKKSVPQLIKSVNFSANEILQRQRFKLSCSTLCDYKKIKFRIKKMKDENLSQSVVRLLFLW